MFFPLVPGEADLGRHPQLGLGREDGNIKEALAPFRVVVHHIQICALLSRVQPRDRLLGVGAVPK